MRDHAHRGPASIELVALTKDFGGAAPAVDAIDLRIASGSYCCLLGPSGCGKSTMLRMIAGLEEPTGGQIVIGGDSFFDHDPLKLFQILWG